jgi:putative transcriptional regulator
MPIVVDIDVMLARRKMAVGTLADRVGITPANLAVLKNGRAKAVRFTTLAALCEVLECQPGDLLRWEPEEPEGATSAESGRSRSRATGRGPSSKHGRRGPSPAQRRSRRISTRGIPPDTEVVSAALTNPVRSNTPRVPT